MLKLFREIKQGQTWTSFNDSGIWEYTVAETNPDSEAWEDINSIENWDLYYYENVLDQDYKYVRERIKEIMNDKGGFNSCTAAEKYKICCWMASDIGAEYNNGESIMTDDEQDEWLKRFDNRMRRSRIQRDEAVTRLIQRKIRKGILDKSDLEVDFIRNANVSSMRESYRLDGFEGNGYGDNEEGYFNYVMNTSTYVGFDIIGVNTGDKKFTIDGDHTATFVADQKFVVKDSTGNDTQYTVVSSELVSDDTVITVSEAIADATVDGTIYYNGFLGCTWTTSALLTEIEDIYINGNYVNGVY